MRNDTREKNDVFSCQVTDNEQYSVKTKRPNSTTSEYLVL